jgi:predicted RNA binding protein YcfA (HicA-like mRNA interferase family)
MIKISNISTPLFRKFLKKAGCNKIRMSGGHEVWSRDDLDRPIVIQSSKKIVPEFIILNNLRTLKMDKKTFLEIINDL